MALSLNCKNDVRGDSNEQRSSRPTHLNTQSPASDRLGKGVEYLESAALLEEDVSLEVGFGGYSSTSFLFSGLPVSGGNVTSVCSGHHVLQACCRAFPPPPPGMDRSVWNRKPRQSSLP